MHRTFIERVLSAVITHLGRRRPTHRGQTRLPAKIFHHLLVLYSWFSNWPPHIFCMFDRTCLHGLFWSSYYQNCWQMCC